MVKLALLDEARQGLDSILNGYSVIDASRLEEVQSLGAAKGRVDVVDASVEVLRPVLYVDSQ